ncbi:hypothetical protein [Profundibacter sp.]|uniref:hypothetical protein n=1 Tax=Profundibacter sp. TaxID=3101071 RepID=UPI003D1274E5
MGQKNREFAARLAEKHAVQLTAQERHHAGRELGKSAVAYKLDAEGTRKLFKALSRDVGDLAGCKISEKDT